MRLFEYNLLYLICNKIHFIMFSKIELKYNFETKFHYHMYSKLHIYIVITTFKIYIFVKRSER